MVKKIKTDNTNILDVIRKVRSMFMKGQCSLFKTQTSL